MPTSRRVLARGSAADAHARRPAREMRPARAASRSVQAVDVVAGEAARAAGPGSGGRRRGGGWPRSAGVGPPRRRSRPLRRTTAPRTRPRLPAAGSASRGGRSGGRTRRRRGDQPCRRPYPAAVSSAPPTGTGPAGGAIGAAAARSPARRIAAMSPARAWPRPASTRVPTIAAHHLVAEGGGLDLEAQHAVAAGRSTRRLEHPRHERHRRPRRPAPWAGGRTSEVVLADERVAGQPQQRAGRAARRRATRCAARNGSGTGRLSTV